MTKLNKFIDIFNYIYDLRVQLELLKEFGINIQEINNYLIQEKVGVNSLKKELELIKDKISQFYSQIK